MTGRTERELRNQRDQLAEGHKGMPKEGSA
jgi:hypothetical protein